MTTMNRFTKLAAAAAVLAADATDWLLVEQERAGVKLVWTRDNISEGRLDWAGAAAAVAKLNLEKFGGFDDWRLPTVEELFLLADRTKYNPAIDTAFFPGCKANAYWSGTPEASSPSDYAWSVGFYDGNSHYYLQSYECFVRAVRASQ